MRNGSRETGFFNYLVYSIGEIILVVIGILIAFYIDSRKEESAKEDIRQAYYQLLLDDLKKDSVYCGKKIIKLAENKQQYEEYLVWLNGNMNPEDVLKAQTNLNPFYENLHFNTNTIATLQTTGDIKLIPGDLRNMLSDLKNQQDATIQFTDFNYTVYIRDLLSAVELGIQNLYSGDMLNTTAI